MEVDHRGETEAWTDRRRQTREGDVGTASQPASRSRGLCRDTGAGKRTGSSRSRAPDCAYAGAVYGNGSRVCEGASQHSTYVILEVVARAVASVESVRAMARNRRNAGFPLARDQIPKKVTSSSTIGRNTTPG